jgi:hypothetical protein
MAGGAITRREFIAGAAAIAAGGRVLLASSPAEAAGTGRLATLVLAGTPAVRLDFPQAKIFSAGAPATWRAQLAAADPAVQKALEDLYRQFFDRNVFSRGSLITYNSDGAIKARYTYADGFPATVTVYGAGAARVLTTRVVWAMRILTKVS